MKESTKAIRSGQSLGIGRIITLLASSCTPKGVRTYPGMPVGLIPEQRSPSSEYSMPHRGPTSPELFSRLRLVGTAFVKSS